MNLVIDAEGGSRVTRLETYDDLRQRIAELEEELSGKWISVEEKLPPIDPSVLIVQPEWKETELVLAWGDCSSFGDDAYLVFYDYSVGKWFCQDGWDSLQWITHWQPFTPPSGTAYGRYPSQLASPLPSAPKNGEAK